MSTSQQLDLFVFLYDTGSAVSFHRMSACLPLAGCEMGYIRTTSSSESSRPWMLLLSRTACWCLLPLVWLNRCTSEVICKHKHSGQRSALQTQKRKRQEKVNRIPMGNDIPYNETLPAWMNLNLKREWKKEMWFSSHIYSSVTGPYTPTT